jgi:hypothetical protein
VIQAKDLNRKLILNLKAVFSSTTTVLAPSSWHSIAVLKNKLHVDIYSFLIYDAE